MQQQQQGAGAGARNRSQRQSLTRSREQGAGSSKGAGSREQEQMKSRSEKQEGMGCSKKTGGRATAFESMRGLGRESASQKRQTCRGSRGSLLQTSQKHSKLQAQPSKDSGCQGKISSISLIRKSWKEKMSDLNN
eukprot:758417-Hanusia_phi.AAC.8